MDPRRLLITAGPTHEPIDAVRYIGNRSSGRLGIALARAACARGMETTLILGPTQQDVPTHSHLRMLRFQTAAELQTMLVAEWPAHDILLMAAAVADFRVRGMSGAGSAGGDSVGGQSVKLRRAEGGLTLDLERTPDLLAAAAAGARPDQMIVGFALEPASRLIESALEKLRRKGVTAIVANPLETMDSPTITATLILAGGRTVAAPPDITKEAFADWLLDALAAMERS